MPTINISEKTLGTLDTLITAQVVSELKARYSGRRLLRLSSKAAEVVALSPNMAEVDELKAMLDDKRAGAAMEWLVRKCVVHPEKAAVDELLARKPLLVEGWYKRLREEAGGGEEVEVAPVPASDVNSLASLHPAAGLFGREVVMLKSASGKVTAKVPGTVEMREFRRRNQAGEREVLIADWLTRTCMVEPDKDGLNAILDRKPLLMEKWFAALVNEGGAAEKVEVGEL